MQAHRRARIKHAIATEHTHAHGRTVAQRVRCVVKTPPTKPATTKTSVLKIVFDLRIAAVVVLLSRNALGFMLARALLFFFLLCFECGPNLLLYF